MGRLLHHPDHLVVHLPNPHRLAGKAVLRLIQMSEVFADHNHAVAVAFIDIGQGAPGDQLGVEKLEVVRCHPERLGIEPLPVHIHPGRNHVRDRDIGIGEQ